MKGLGELLLQNPLGHYSVLPEQFCTLYGIIMALERLKWGIAYCKEIMRVETFLNAYILTLFHFRDSDLISDRDDEIL